ncbi:MAG: FtsX-like permease family protein [Acidobacteriota bacterium]
MPFGPIFRAMTRNRARFLLIVAEVALTLAIVANCVSLIRQSRAELARESGFDDENLLSVTSRAFAEAFREDNYLDAAIDADARTLNAMPGVRAASNTYFVPWIGGGSSTEVMEGEKRFRTQFYPADLRLLDTLGVKLVQGRSFTREEFAPGSGGSAPANAISPALISEKLADLMYPQGGAVGKVIRDSQGVDAYRVVGVFGPFYNPYGWPIGDYAIFYPARSGNFRSIQYLVRAAPGQARTLIPEIEKTLLAANNGRNVEVKSIVEIRSFYNSRDQSVVVALNAVMILLVFVTALGIVGITSFSVAERQRQIGTRRALGATQADILRHFLLENWMVTTIGAVLGAGLAYAINVGLVTMVDGAKLDGWILVAGVGLLWAVGLGAALGPALKAARIAPAIATRNV